MHLADDRSFFTVYDGTALLFRHFFGMRSLRSTEGTEVGGTVGVAQAISTLMRRQRPRYVAIVFDAGQKTFRSELAPDYKANRSAPPDELIPQFDLVQKMTRALGFSTYCLPGFEADDLMATLVELTQQAQVPSRLVSADKDLCQLVRDDDPSVILYSDQKSRYFDETGATERLGVPPQFAIDYQALVGDSTDNIAGVNGVGPKAAKALIDAFGHLDSIYEHLEDVPTLSIRGAKSLAKKLEKGKQAAFLSKQLVTLRRDVPLGLTPQQLLEETEWKGPTPEAIEFFDKLGFPRPFYQLRDLARSPDYAYA